MRVIGAVAAAAVSPELLLFDDARVTCVTVESGVCALQREERLVIVSGDLPEVIPVTVAAAGA